MEITRLHAHSPAEHLAQVDDLVQETFGLSFAAWRAAGWWTGDYTGYGIFEQGRLSAYAAAYRLDLLVQDQPQEVLQIGAVATRHERRGQGFSRQIINFILAQRPTTPILLCANPSVLTFYPRFGFRPVAVRQPVIQRTAQTRHGEHPLGLRRLLPGDPLVDAYLRGRAVFSHILDCANAAPINAFHLLHETSLCLYEVERLRALMVVEQAGDTLNLLDVIALRPFSFTDLAPSLDFPGVQSVRFWFNPDWLGVNGEWTKPADDPHLFVRGDWHTPDPFMLPYLMTT